MIEAARSRCKAPSKRPSVPTQWFTPSFSPTSMRTAMALVTTGAVGWAGTVEASQGEVGREEVDPEAEATAVDGIRRKVAWMARKFWIKFQEKPVAVSTKSQKNRQSIKFTTASPRNCGPSTTSATLPTKATPKPDIIRSAWQPNRRTWSSKPEMGITRTDSSEAYHSAKAGFCRYLITHCVG